MTAPLVPTAYSRPSYTRSSYISKRDVETWITSQRYAPYGPHHGNPDETWCGKINTCLFSVSRSTSRVRLRLLSSVSLSGYFTWKTRNQAKLSYRSLRVTFWDPYFQDQDRFQSLLPGLHWFWEHRRADTRFLILCIRDRDRHDRRHLQCVQSIQKECIASDPYTVDPRFGRFSLRRPTSTQSLAGVRQAS